MAPGRRPVVLVVDSSSRASTLMGDLGLPCDVRRAESLASARRVLASSDPGCAFVIAAHLDDGDGFEVLRAARESHPDIPRLIVLDRPTGEQLNAACALQAFVAGEPLTADGLRAFLAPALAHRARGAEQLETLVAGLGAQLSPREREVVIESVYGFTQKEISANRGIELHTVKTYVKRILRKTNVTSIEELTRPLRRALVRPDDPDR